MIFFISYFKKEKAEKGGNPFYQEKVDCLNDLQAWAIAEEQKKFFGKSDELRGNKDIIIQIIGEALDDK